MTTRKVCDQMNRWVSFLCALTLLCLSLTGACAAEQTPFLPDVLQLDVTAEADADAMAAFLTSLQRNEDGKTNALGFLRSSSQITSFAEGLAKLCGGASLSLLLQPDALRFRATLGGEEIAESKAYALPDAPDCVYAESSLLPGMVLAYPVSSATDAWPSLNALADMDWNDFADRTVLLLDSWLRGSECTAATGSFRGDAYSGAVRQVRYHFDERDLLILMQCFAAEFPQFQLQSFFPDQPQSGASQAALLNHYRYDLALGYDSADQFVGGSLTVTADSAQVMTLSVGRMSENRVRLVIGLGLDRGTAYADCILRAQSKDISLVGGSAALEITVHEYEDPYGEGFPAVAQNASRSQGTLTWKGNLRHAENGRWTFTGETALSAGRLSLRQTLEGALTHAPWSFTAVERSFGEDEETPFLTVKMTAVEAEPMTFRPAEDAKLYTLDSGLSDADAQELQSALTSASSALYIRLFRLLPAELIVFLMNQ